MTPRVSDSDVPENKRPTTLRRIGEAVLIVTSILLAFAIDAGWARLQLRTEEAEALVALDAEFTANLRQVNAVIDRHEAGLEFARMLVEMPDDSIVVLPQVTISALMLATANPASFDPVLGTTAALVGAGKLGVLRDSRLREALTSFENFVSDAADDLAFMESLALDVWKAEVRFGAPWSDPATEVGIIGAAEGLGFLPLATAEDLLNVRADREVMGLVGWFHLNAAYYLIELRRIRDHTSIVLELIAESRGGPAF